MRPATHAGVTGDTGDTGGILDIDGDCIVHPLTDGLLLTRAMMGLTGTAVTNNAVGVNATRTSWAQIRGYLNQQFVANYLP